jgi:release factor glutamine methyltransferase
MQVGAWLIAARQKLTETSCRALSDTPGLDLQVLLSHIIQKPRAWIVAHPEYVISDKHISALDEDFVSLSNGIPLPYLIGRQHFMGLEFNVSPDVLIPRPETEELVEIALRWLKANPGAQRVIEIGVGSGCIAASIAHYMPLLSITAIDLSWPAIRIAQNNFINLKVADQIYPLCANLLKPVQAQFDLICANLPYIPTDQLKQLPVYLHEPTLALDGGADGLHIIHSLLEDAPRCLAANGLLLMEIESSLGQQSTRLARQYFPQAEIELHHDLAGRPRIIKVNNHAN